MLRLALGGTQALAEMQTLGLNKELGCQSVKSWFCLCWIHACASFCSFGNLPSQVLPSKARSRRNHRFWRSFSTACTGRCPDEGSKKRCMCDPRSNPFSHAMSSRMPHSGRRRLWRELPGQERSPPARLHALTKSELAEPQMAQAEMSRSLV